MRRCVFALALGGLVACALTTDLDGFTSGATKSSDGGTAPKDAQTTTLPDGRVVEADTGTTQGCSDVTSDPRNCGQCGHDCAGGGCSESKCLPYEIVKNLGRPLGIGLSQNKLYVGVNGGLLEMGLDGKDAKNVVTGVRPRYVWGTDTDVFFSREGDSTIQRWPHREDGSTELVLGAPDLSGVATSPTHVYYTRYTAESKGGGVYRAPFSDLGAVEKLKGWNGAECVAWADGKTYFAGDGSDTANLLNDDGSLDQLLDHGGPTGIFVLGNDAFITRQGSGEVLRVDLSTKASTLLARDLNAPSGVVVTATTIFIAELDAGRVVAIAR